MHFHKSFSKYDKIRHLYHHFYHLRNYSTSFGCVRYTQTRFDDSFCLKIYFLGEVYLNAFIFDSVNLSDEKSSLKKAVCTLEVYTHMKVFMSTIFFWYIEDVKRGVELSFLLLVRFADP